MQGEIPVGFEVRWQTVGMFQDRYELPANVDPAREQAKTVAQGFPNGDHTLTLTAESGRPAGIRAIRIYRPPLR